MSQVAHQASAYLGGGGGGGGGMDGMLVHCRVPPQH